MGGRHSSACNRLQHVPLCQVLLLGLGTQDGGEVEEPRDAPTPPATGEFPWNGHHVAHVERPPQSGCFGESPSALYPGLTEHALKKKKYPLSKIKLTDVRFGLKGKKSDLVFKAECSRSERGQRDRGMFRLASAVNRPAGSSQHSRWYVFFTCCSRY